MNRLLLWVRPGVLIFLGALICSAIPRRAQPLDPPRQATEGLELLYNGDPGAAIERFRSLQNRQPDHPLGYLLEDDARWWQILCESAEYKWGMVDAWHREKLRKDAPFFELADKVIALSEARLKEEETAEMHFYAGMGYAFRARLLDLRDERRTTARAGVEARFYLAKNLRNYDRDYERAAQVAEPLVAEYPQNPIFHLLLGDINAKLKRKEKAAAH